MMHMSPPIGVTQYNVLVDLSHTVTDQAANANNRSPAGCCIDQH